MDGYFSTPSQIQIFPPHLPQARPVASWRPNRFVMDGFWSVRGQWLESYWNPQSEGMCASLQADIWPVYIPSGSTGNVVPMVMSSW